MTDSVQTEPTQTSPALNIPPEPEPQTKRIELRELGARLPLGVVGTDGLIHKDIACKPWRGREEREVSGFKSESQEKGDFVTRLISFMFTRIGPHDFESMKEAERKAVVATLYMGDVLYMYVWLRVQCLGKSLKMDLTCLRCNFEFPYDADLNTVVVRTADSLENAKWSYVLKSPFEIRGEMANSFDLAPTRWQTMETSIKKQYDAGDANGSGTKMDMIEGCIKRVTGREDMVLISKEFDDMLKVDIERLATRIDKHEVGPDLSVKEKCPRCKRDFVTTLDWGYESFFGDSSLS